MNLKGTLSWFSPPLEGNQGYGYAAIEMLEALNRAGIRTNYYNDNTDPLDRVNISWIQPEWYEGHSWQYRIGYTPWESTEIPDQWRKIMNCQQEIWTTSKFCKEVYEESGVEVPIHVFPHGINPEHYPIMERDLHQRFVFCHIGAPCQRKGGQMVFNAFEELFDGNQNVELIMKSSGVSDVRFYQGEDNLRNVRHHPQVTVVEENLTSFGMTALYEQAHCLVYPSQGEGFGFIPFQGIATGLPTIVTNGTAMADYANLSYPLDWDWEEAYGIHLGKWCKPSYEDLKRQMLWIYENWDLAQKKTLRGAEWIHQNQTWDHIAQRMVDHLGSRISL